MVNKIILVLACGLTVAVQGQVIQDPIGEVSRLRKGEAGRVYSRWIVDLNHDGRQDVLVCLPWDSAEIEREEANDDTFDRNFHTFHVFMAQGKGSYIQAKQMDGGLARINVAECYVGYIREIKHYGVVTVEELIVDAPNEPRARHGVTRKQVYCYTVEGDRIKKKDLTPLFSPNAKNAIYEEYLAEAKRTKVQLQEFKQ